MAETGGQPGNTNSARGRVWTAAVKRALARLSAQYGDEIPSVDKGLDRLADRLVGAAAGGDKDAYAIIEKIGDRLEGKPAMVIAGADDMAPVRLEGVLRLVKPESEPTEGGT